MFFNTLVSTVVVISALGSDANRVDSDYPIVPVPFNRVSVESDFWQPRLQTNRQVTVWYDFQKCEETERIANFARAGGLEDGGFVGIPFNDSDVFKVIEGASYCLALQDDPKLDEYLDGLIAKIAAAQEDDGYLYSARTLGVNNGFTGPSRWSNLGTNHELYNVGHMYEAAVAHFQATGKRTLLDVAIKNADLICKVFGLESGQLIDVPGHQEIEIGLVKLFRTTGNEDYLRLAKFFVDMRGRSDLRNPYGAYSQDHIPISEQSEPVGHAVRAGYFYAGVADIAAMTGGEEYLNAVDRIWEHIVTKKMHLTGGIGASPQGEAFGADYELPNESAYLETCAAIAHALFNHRMFLLHGDGKYFDVLERILYNGFLSGISMSGDEFFYPNPLACDGHRPFNIGNMGRAPWFSCSCCPVNVVRFLPSIPGYAYAVRDDTVFVNLYMEGEAIADISSQPVTLRQETNYPWDGDIKITVEPQETEEFELRLRIPGWVSGRPVPGDLYSYKDSKSAAWSIAVNGDLLTPHVEDGYVVVNRTWKRGDSVSLRLPMDTRRVLAHQNVKADRGRVAIERGPIVYCLEAVDNGGQITNIALPDDSSFSVEHHEDLLGGVTIIRTSGLAGNYNQSGGIDGEEVELTAVPYYAWAHREIGEMAVWIPRDLSIARPTPLPTIASQSKASASHVYGSDTIHALMDQVEPSSSGDHSIPRFTWWDHRGGTEWVQYEFAEETLVSGVDVYWFDDTGRGQCRVPVSWRLLYQEDGRWRSVNTEQKYGVTTNKLHSVNFKSVRTKSLRLEVQLQEGFSGGIHEWKVR